MAANKKQLVLEEDDFEVDNKMAQRLQRLKSRNVVNTPTSSAKIAAKLLEVEEKEEEEEEKAATVEEEEVEEKEDLEEEGAEEDGEEGEGEAEEGEGKEEDGKEEEGEGVEKPKGKTKKPSKQWAMYFDDDEQKEDKKVMSTIDMEKMKKDIENRGIIYLSNVPPNTNQDKLKHYFTSNFGMVTRIHLTQRSSKEMKAYKQKTGHNSTYFHKEGWIEFKDKEIAKRVALSLSGTQVGGRGFESKAVWNIKYLSKFKWSYLIEKLYQQKADAHKVMTQKVEEAKKEIEAYREDTEKANRIKNSSKRKKALKDTAKPIPQIQPHQASHQASHANRKRLPMYDQLVASKKSKTASGDT